MLQAGWSAKEHREGVENKYGNLGKSLITKMFEFQAKDSGLDSIVNRELLKISERGRT